MDLALFITVLVALLLGWLVGIFSRRKPKALSVDSLPSGYIQSLTFLVSEQPDEAIDKLLGVFEVNEITFDTHIALGTIVRRRGELEQAIKIHQNLIARPNLGRKHQDRAHFELAKDYLQAGLLDRAETLLKDLLEKQTDYQRDAQLLLLSLYEDESEWGEALALAETMLPKRLLRQRTAEEQKLALKIVHYHCQIAEQAYEAQNYDSVLSAIDKALSVDKTSLRAVYLKAKLAAARGLSAEVLKLLPNILFRDSKLLFEGFWLVAKATQDWPQEKVVILLSELYQDTRSAGVLELLLAKSSDAEHMALLENHISQKPTMKAMALWLKYTDALSDVPSEKQALLHRVVEQLRRNKKRYQCQNCGFKGVQFFWHCPTCKEWDTMEILRGNELD